MVGSWDTHAAPAVCVPAQPGRRRARDAAVAPVRGGACRSVQLLLKSAVAGGTRCLLG